MSQDKRNLLIVLVGFPLIYFVYSLTPLAKELFEEGNNSLFIPFWSGIILFHWMSIFAVKAFLKRENKSFRDIGYVLNSKKTILLVFSYLAIALLVFGFTEWSLNYVSIDEEKLSKLSNFFPKTSAQRMLFIVTVFTAGVVEEIVYRGYAITKLSDVGLNKWLAIIPAGITFVFIHGIVSVSSYGQFLFYFVFALVLGVIFLLSKRLLPNIIIHLLFDLTAMMAVFQAIAS